MNFNRSILAFLFVAVFSATAFAQQDILKSSTAYVCEFGLVQTDHIANATGLTPTVLINKNGGSYSSPSGSVSEISHGKYKIALNATDTNTDGPIRGLVDATGSNDPTWFDCGVVVDWNPRSVPTLANLVDAVLDEALSSHTTTGTVGENLSDTNNHTHPLTFTVGNQADANVLDYKSSTAPSLVGGRFDASVGANQSGVDFSATEKASIRTAASPVVQKNVAKEWPLKMRDLTTGLPMTSGSPTCVRGLDSVTSVSGTANSPSSVNASGNAEITLAGSDLNGSFYTYLKCTMTGASDYEYVFLIQP